MESSEAATPDVTDRLAHPDVTVLFVDLVQFTALTSVHGDTAGAEAAGALYEIVRGTLGSSGRMIKTLGDGVLLTHPTPALGLQCAAAVIEQLHELATGLDARCGADHGPVVDRAGDVFGSTVNRAARLSAVAQPGTIAATRVIARAAGDIGLAATPLGQRELKGFLDRVETFHIDPCAHVEDVVTDPVCGMRLRADGAIDVRRRDGRSIGFCSQRCADEYRSAPERF
jgi:class 3 adenylate cyclase/YHS domain-containing protein